MKLLLDENLPHKLRGLLPGHDCFTADYMSWSGVQNGDLLQLASAEHFDALISTERGLEYEQNQATLPISVVVLIAGDNKLQTLEALIPLLLEKPKTLQPRQVVKVGSRQDTSFT